MDQGFNEKEMSIYNTSLQRMILDVRLVTNKSPAEAQEVIFKLSEWVCDKEGMSLESAFRLYIEDIKRYGQSNLTATAFI